jgi:hypothetical protein
MNRDIAEIIGLAVAALGWGVICGAAALVSVALCVLLAGIGLLFAGGLVAYVANVTPKTDGTRS